jgi:hypothetical protein
MLDKLRVQTERSFFALTERELNELAGGSRSPWRDYTLALAPFSLALLLNALDEFYTQSGGQGVQFTVGLFLNCVIGISSLLVSFGFGLVWWKTTRRRTMLLDIIHDRPEHVLITKTNQLSLETLPAQTPVVEIAAVSETPQ